MSVTSSKPLGPWGYDSSLEKKTDEPTKKTTTTTTKTALKDFIHDFFPADLWYGRRHGVPAGNEVQSKKRVL